MGGLLSHLFRGGISLQPVVVSCGRAALALCPIFLMSMRLRVILFVGGHVAATPVGGTAQRPPGHGKEPWPAAHGPTTQISPLNFVTLAAFLASFGGAGYLLTRFSTVWFVTGLSLAIGSGLIGGTIVFLFLSRVLISQEEIMDPADYEMAGVLGRVSVPIRASGTGEIIYSQAGTRRTCGARGEDGSAIPKGTEVVVTRYQKGIAYVRLWTEMSAKQIQCRRERPRSCSRGKSGSGNCSGSLGEVNGQPSRSDQN